MFLGSHSGACPVGQDERVVTCVHCDDVTQGSHCPESFGLPRASLPKPLVPAGPSLSPRLCLFQKVPSGEHTGCGLAESRVPPAAPQIRQRVSLQL